MVNIPDPRRAFPGQVEPTLSLTRPSAGSHHIGWLGGREKRVNLIGKFTSQALALLSLD